MQSPIFIASAVKQLSVGNMSMPSKTAKNTKKESSLSKWPT